MSEAERRIPIPQEYAAKLKAARSDRTLQGERRLVTILFSDVKGSTAMAEDRDPEEWAEIMGQAFDYLIAPIYRYEGTLARLMGDAILAFFGAPLAHEDDPVRAIRAGLDILEGIGPFCERVRRDYGLDFGVRVGINTGTVVVGDIGSDLAMEYTAMGDAVNIASRMEQTAAPGTVQIAESTYKLVAPLFDLEPLGGIEIRGRREPVPAYRVLGLKATPGRLRGIEGLSTELVGRSRELEVIQRAFQDLREGRGGLLCLVGEAGLGKSRLIEEARSRIGSAPVMWVQAGGVSYDMTRPYSLFQQLFRTLCSITERDTPEEARKRIENLCEDFQPEVEQDAARAAELVLTFAQESSISGAGGEALKRELFERMLTAWRKPAILPLVMVFDDLHWADRASAELLQHLFQLSDEIPVLFLCALRPYREGAGWDLKAYAEKNYPHRLQLVELKELSDQDSLDLINGLLAVSELPIELGGLIRGKAEGNPFFLEELIRTLIDQGAIVRDESGTRWRAVSDLEQISLPDTLQALLVSRIDRLDKEIRRTLQLASVIGRAFYYRVLEWIAEARDRLRDQLNVLQRVELIAEHSRVPELEYVFKHDLTRDAAYESILKKERPQFHRQVGEAIEALFPEKLEEESHRLAYHYREAKDDEKALKYYTLAGNMARRLSAYSEAISHYGQALELARRSEASPAQFNLLYTRRGRMYELAGRYDEALDNYREMREQAGQSNEPALELTSLNSQATIHAIPSGKWDPDRAKELATRALALAEQLGDPRGEAKALWNLMLVEVFAERDIQAAIPYGERSLAIAREHGLLEEEAYAAHDLSRAYSQAGQVEQAAEVQRQARDLWERLGNAEMLADNLTASAFGLLLKGQLAASVEMATRALEISRKTGNNWGQAYSSMSLGLAYLERGEISRGVLAFEEGIHKARQANFNAAEMFVNSLLALTYFRLGDLGRAFERIEAAPESVNFLDPTRLYTQGMKALILASQGNPAEVARLLGEFAGEFQARSTNPEFLGFSSFLQVEMLIANRQLEEAIEFADRRIDQLQALQAHFFVPQLRLSQGRALRGLGRTEQALATLDQASQPAERMELRLTLLFALLETAELAEQAGQAERAAAARRSAREAIEFISSHIEDESLRASFRSLPAVQSSLAA